MDNLSFDSQKVQSPSHLATDVAQKPRMPCIALMGEFSAGKTTLINFLLGEDLLPTRVTATQLPPVWMSFGERAAHYVDIEGNHHDLDIENLHAVPVHGVRYIKLFCDADVLLEMDLIDTPGISDPNIPDHYRAAVVEHVDAVIWCTHATQAWRESERSVWATIPEHLQANSILLATRSDKLGERDRGRVKQRLQRETGDKFRSIIMFSATDAIRACQVEDEAELMASSGGEALIETLQSIAAEVAQASGTPRLSLKNSEAPSAEATLAQPAVQPTRVSVVRPARVERMGNRRPEGADADILTATDDEAIEPSAELDPVASDDDVAAIGTSETDDEIGTTSGADTDTAELDAEYDNALAAALSDDPVDDAAETDELLEDSNADGDIDDVGTVEMPDGGNEVGVEAESPTAEDAATPAQHIIDMASSVEDDYEDENTAITGVLDLKKYEISQTPQPEPVIECEDTDDTDEISDGMAYTGEEVAEAQDDTEATDGNVDAPQTEMADPSSATVIWADILAANPVETVPDLLAAFTRFIETLDQNGMVISVPAHDVDMVAEEGETSPLRMHG
ncbi:MAG: dynamin family protein [Albidovulum sp.]